MSSQPISLSSYCDFEQFKAIAEHHCQEPLDLVKKIYTHVTPKAFSRNIRGIQLEQFVIEKARKYFVKVCLNQDPHFQQFKLLRKNYDCLYSCEIKDLQNRVSVTEIRQACIQHALAQWQTCPQMNNLAVAPLDIQSSPSLLASPAMSRMLLSSTLPTTSQLSPQRKRTIRSSLFRDL